MYCLTISLSALLLQLAKALCFQMLFFIIQQTNHFKSLHNHNLKVTAFCAVILSPLNLYCRDSTHYFEYQ